MPEMKFTGGLPETRCGAGSTLAFTEEVRQHLPGLLRRYGVMSMVDAPCGDCNWIGMVDMPGVRYTGIDFDPVHVADARNRPFWSVYEKMILCRDVMEGNLPHADLLLCRDFLQHLPSYLVRKFLSNFHRSRTSLLLTTNHEPGELTDIAEAGQFRRLDLRSLGLPEPRERIPDGPGRCLALWHRDDVAE